MKGNLVTGMIAIMIGAVLIFAVVVPIMQNATLGTEYTETITNASAEASTVVLTTTQCVPIRTDLTGVYAVNSTGDDETSKMTVHVSNTTDGQYLYTNTSVLNLGTSNSTAVIELSYRCTGGAEYIDNTIGRTIADIIVPLVIVLLIVGLTAFLI